MSDEEERPKGPLALALEEVRGRAVVRPKEVPLARVKPHIGQLMASAYIILHGELEQLKSEQAQKGALSPGSTVRLNKNVNSLVALAKEEREQEAKNDPARLSDEELLAKVEDAKKALAASNPAPSPEDNDDL